MDGWQRRRRKLRRQFLACMMTTLLTSSLVLNGIRSHDWAELIVGVAGVLLGPWVMFRTWQDIRENDTKV
jgi:predicted membrane protein